MTTGNGAAVPETLYLINKADADCASIAAARDGEVETIADDGLRELVKELLP